MIRNRHHRRRSHWARRKARLSHVGRARARARWRKERAERIAHPPAVDADTLRKRALHDRRGKLIRHGVFIRWHGDALRTVAWEIRHSLRGRVNQVDCIRSGILRRTCSLRTAERLLRF